MPLPYRRRGVNVVPSTQRARNAMSLQDPNFDFFASDAKVGECRRQSDQLDYFVHVYCKLYGDWKDAQARVADLRRNQNLALILGAAIGIPLISALAYLHINQLVIVMTLLLLFVGGYLLLDQVRREQDRCEQLNRERESFGLSAYLTGSDLSLDQLEASISKDLTGHWVLTPAYEPWRDAHLRGVFHRVYGVPVPLDVIKQICQRA
jgi:hypothetical protein